MAVSPNALAEICGPDIFGRIATFLPPNEVACTLKLVNRAFAEQFKDHTVVQLAQPSPAAEFAFKWSAPGACRALSFKRRLQLVCLTAASGNVANLEVALEATGLSPTVEVMAAAAAACQLHVCRWLAARGCPLEARSPPDGTLAAAAKGGHEEACEWLLEQGCAWGQECVTSAALGGHPELMRALLRKAPPGREGTVSAHCLLTSAAEGCDLDTNQELWRERAGEASGGVNWPKVRSAAVVKAARSRTPDRAAKVAWLLEQGVEWSGARGVCAAAASCPDAVARLTLLVEGMGLPADAASVDAAIGAGRTDALHWLLARGLRPTASTQPRCAAARLAAMRGHTEVLRALRTARCGLIPPQELAYYACLSEGVETISWLVEKYGAKVLRAAGSRAFDAALSIGSLELVTWLRERGMGPGPNPWQSAVSGGCAPAIEQLKEWGVNVRAIPVQEEGWPDFCHRESAYLKAARRGDVPTLEALRRLGLPLSRSGPEKRALLAKAIRYETPLPALRWLRRALGDVHYAAAADAARELPSRVRCRAEVHDWVEAERLAAVDGQI